MGAGGPLADLIEVVDYWRTEYDWRTFEDRLNQFGQFRTTIDGLGIHFLHRRSPRANATPPVLTHGWPGSIAEFIHVIDELADPTNADAPAFHIVDPSLPGFGYSDKPEWSDTEDSPFEWISIDRILGNVTLYWLTRSGASAARIYYESHGSLDPDLRVDVSSAITIYPRDIEKCPLPWARKRCRKIVRWRTAEAGGHFPSLEVPEYFVRDLQEGLKVVLGAGR